MSAGPTVRGVLLDFYGTLAEATSWGPPFGEILEHHGLDPAAADGRWRSATVDGTDHAVHSGSRDAYVAWERSRLEELATLAGAPTSRLAPVVDDLYDASKAFELRPYGEAAAVLGELASLGYSLAVCSNWDWDLPERCTELGLDTYFDHIVTSARVGARKPHPRIYGHTLAALGIPAGESVFVGDTFEPDVAGPVAAGMRAVHVVRDGHPTPDGPLPALPRRARRLGDLSGLPALLDEWGRRP